MEILFITLILNIGIIAVWMIVKIVKFNKEQTRVLASIIQIGTIYYLIFMAQEVGAAIAAIVVLGILLGDWIIE